MENQTTEIAKSNPAYLLQLAIEQKADLAQLEKLMDLNVTSCSLLQAVLEKH